MHANKKTKKTRVHWSRLLYQGILYVGVLSWQGNTWFFFSFLTSKASFKMEKPKKYSKFYEKGLRSKRGSDLAVSFSFNKDTSHAIPMSTIINSCRSSLHQLEPSLSKKLKCQFFIINYRVFTKIVSIGYYRWYLYIFH